jgi:hypothetical protein
VSPFPTISAMVPISDQWRCRICDFDRYHLVTVLKKNGQKYETSFYAWSQCSVMFLSPAQFDANSAAAPNVEAPGHGHDLRGPEESALATACMVWPSRRWRHDSPAPGHKSR